MDKAMLVIKNHLGVIVSGVLAVAAAVVFLVINLTKTDYRTIQIYEVNGTSSIEREGTGTMKAVENLYLQSGDRVTVSAGSTMRLKLDDDKYVMVEENSVLTIVAKGTKKDSLTTIKLEQGAITNEIRNLLSKKSSYEVITPNAVMAVRGTVFRVAVWVDEKGILYTKVDTFEGKVGVKRILPDGSIQEEDAYISGGYEVIIYMDEQITEYLSEPKEISYEELPVETLSFLKDCIENGRKIVGISEESLEELIVQKEAEEAAEVEDMAGNGAADGTIEDEMTETEEQAQEEELLEPEEEAAEAVEPESNQTAVSEAEEAVQEQPFDFEELPVIEQEEELQQEQQTTASGSSSSSDSDDEPSSEQSSYTVTFRASDGSAFGTQTVEAGGTATRPKMQPEPDGNWDFDFTQAITADTTISWKQ